jgi:hypothetical protein
MVVPKGRYAFPAFRIEVPFVDRAKPFDPASAEVQKVYEAIRTLAGLAGLLESR